MNFFGMGPFELVVVLVLALIVFGPGRLPEIGAGIGRALREFRRMSSEFTDEFSKMTNELTEEVGQEIKSVTTEVSQDVKSVTGEMSQDFKSVIDYNSPPKTNETTPASTGELVSSSTPTTEEGVAPAGDMVAAAEGQSGEPGQAVSGEETAEAALAVAATSPADNGQSPVESEPAIEPMAVSEEHSVEPELPEAAAQPANEATQPVEPAALQGDATAEVALAPEPVDEVQPEAVDVQVVESTTAESPRRRKRRRVNGSAGAVSLNGGTAGEPGAEDGNLPTDATAPVAAAVLPVEEATTPVEADRPKRNTRRRKVNGEDSPESSQ